MKTKQAQSGQAIIEYILLLALVVLSSAALLGYVSKVIKLKVGRISAELLGKSPSSHQDQWLQEEYDKLFNEK